MRTTINNGDSGLVARTAINNNFINSNIKVYNVEDYGTVHDGSTDDTEAIQDAINACFAAGGGVVYFPNGIYILSGALQNGIGGINFNSQLYIPYSAAGSSVMIRLIGESVQWLPACTTAINDKGVVLKSTIAGTGDFPSVICGLGENGVYGTMTYTEVHMEFIKIVVDAFESTTGPSMSGINFVWVDQSYIDHVTVTIDCGIMDSIEPTSHVFGIAIGATNNDHPEIGVAYVSGFYYGIILGEGAAVFKAEVFWCHIGFMFIKNFVQVHIHNGLSLHCAYAFSGQQETIMSVTASYAIFKIDSMFIEQGESGGSRTPAWCDPVDIILDAENYLHGFMDYQMSGNGGGAGQTITKSNGGVSFFLRNLFGPGNYHWTTAERTAAVASAGVMGFNTTTSKIEWWDSGSWHVLT